MDYEKLLRALLSRAYKLDSEQINAILAHTEQGDVETALFEADKDRVKTLSTAPKGQTFQDGYAKAKKEERAAFEAEIKEKFGVVADVTGIELIELVVTDKAGDGKGGNKGTITDEEVKKTPAYQALEASMKKALKDKEAEWTTKYDERETQIKKGETFGRARIKALEILDGLNPVLPTNPNVAQNIRNVFADSFKDYEFDFQEDGKRIVVMKDGKVVDDGHGNSLAFEDLVKNSAGGYFEFKNNNGGGNSGNNNNNAQPATVVYPAGITKPKTIDELAKITNDDTIKLEDRQTVMQVWETENP